MQYIWPLVVLTGFLAIPIPRSEELPKPRLAEPDIQGYYEVSGIDISGKPYQGIAIIRRIESIYLVQWILGDLGFRGVGLREGDKLVVGYVQMDRPFQGVYSYKINPGRLVGRWVSVPGDGTVRTEDMVLLKVLENGGK